MGERLPCAVRSIAEVRAITEEAFAVQAVEGLTLAPRTMSHVSVIVSAMNAKGTVMVEIGPGPLGLCPVQGVAEVDRDTKIWLANLGSQPVEIEGEQVVAMAERVSETGGMDTGTTEGGRDGMVRRAAQHLTDVEHQQLEVVLLSRRHLFASEKGDLGRTSLVNAPATFERLMERVLRGMAWSECLVYIDDILVFGPDFATTLEQ